MIESTGGHNFIFLNLGKTWDQHVNSAHADYPTEKKNEKLNTSFRRSQA